MIQLGMLLTLGYLGGLRGQLGWLWLASLIVLFGTPLHLVYSAGVGCPVLVTALTFVAVFLMQTAVVAGLLDSEQAN